MIFSLTKCSMRHTHPVTAMTGAATLAAPGSFTVVCDDNSGDESIAFAYITAIQVGALANN